MLGFECIIRGAPTFFFLQVRGTGCIVMTLKRCSKGVEQMSFGPIKLVTEQDTLQMWENFGRIAYDDGTKCPPAGLSKAHKAAWHRGFKGAADAFWGRSPAALPNQGAR